MLRYYRRMLPHEAAYGQIGRAIAAVLGQGVEFSAEWCYYLDGLDWLSDTERLRAEYLLGETFDPDGLRANIPWLTDDQVLEFGPRPNFPTAASTSSITMLEKIGVSVPNRLEKSRRINFGQPIDESKKTALAESLHDHMTEMLYETPPTSFQLDVVPRQLQRLPLCEQGIAVLMEYNKLHSLGLDQQDIEWIMGLFVEQLQRDPYDIEVRTLAEIMSDHMRHLLWNGLLVRDGVELEQSLMQMVKQAYRRHPGNNLVAFADDASVIGSYEVETVLCEDPSGPGLLYVARRCYGLTTKNESHNHPTMYQPFQGAATGAGGLLRDLKVVGRGGLITSTSTAYCTARPAIQGLGWVESPTNKTGATDIMIGASNGASAYTNCEGFAATMGLLNTFEQIMPSGDKVGYRKPIMQAGGFGKIDLEHLKAQPLQVGQKVCVLGGANFRVGIGGASASSQTGGEIDLNVALASVQRGDPEMQRRVYEVVKALVGMGKGNIIVDAHDMGAGGNAGCLSEIAEKEGARYYVQAFRIGDVTLDLIEFWINESQERIALVVNEADLELLLKVARRHNCPCDVVGEITGDGVLTLHDDEQGDVLSIELARFLGSERRKRIEFESWQPQLLPLALPERTLQQHFERHLRHPKSGSKRFLVTKADRSVLGRTARQQCVGPWGLTVSDFAIEALTELRADSPGQAKSMAEAAVAGLIDPEEMVRLTVAEAVMNLMGARITKVTDISLQANWMAPAKLTGEMDRYVRAVEAYSSYTLALEAKQHPSEGIATNGGKDSNSMVDTDQEGDDVRSPLTLIATASAPIDDVRDHVTPDLKARQWGLGQTELLWVRFANWSPALGGSILADVYDQLGNEVPRAPEPQDLMMLKEAMHQQIDLGRILAVHDTSSGLLPCAAEMALSGGVGIMLDLPVEHELLGTAFGEAPSLLLECRSEDLVRLQIELAFHGFLVNHVGCTQQVLELGVSYRGVQQFSASLNSVLNIWESASHYYDERQSNPATARLEYSGLDLRNFPEWKITYQPVPTPAHHLLLAAKPRVAVICEQGTNGHDEMATAWMLAGFDACIVTMYDLINSLANGSVSLSDFHVIVFAGGFSYGDVLDAAKGWAAVIRYNSRVADEFAAFRARSDTLVLGICNGCQLLALLGWISPEGTPDVELPRFIRNESERFESRFVMAEVTESPAVLLQGMVGSRLGIWGAHGEGRWRHGPHGAVAMRYVLPHSGEQAGVEHYPHNPNGSPDGVAGVCSEDGRTLADMLHFERSAHQLWQAQWMPYELRQLQASPWLKPFQNGYDFVRNS